MLSVHLIPSQLWEKCISALCYGVKPFSCSMLLLLDQKVWLFIRVSILANTENSSLHQNELRIQIPPEKFCQTASTADDCKKPLKTTFMSSKSQNLRVI